MVSQHIVFTFAGQGYPPVEAARDLYRTSEVFKQAVTKVENTIDSLLRDGAIPDRTFIPLTQYLEEEEIRPPHAPSFNQSPTTNQYLTAPTESLIIVTAQYALGKMLQSWGIAPQSIMAYSLGEAAAAAVTGSYTLPALLKLLARRDKLLGDRTLTPDKGGFALIFADGDTVKQVLAKEGMLGAVDIAGFSNPVTTCLAGDAHLMDLALEKFAVHDIAVKPVKLDIGMHSQHVEKLANMVRSDPDIFPEADSKDCKIVPGIDHWSSLGFQMPTGSPLNANHYATVLRRPLRYKDCIQGIFRKHMAERPKQKLVFIDMGMGPGQLYKSIKATLQHTPEWERGLVKGIASIDPLSASADSKATVGWAESQLRANLRDVVVSASGSALASGQGIQQQQRRYTHTQTARPWQLFAQGGPSANPWIRTFPAGSLNLRFFRRALFRL